MKRFIKTTLILFKKDFKDALRNTSMSILLVLPIFVWPYFSFRKRSCPA
ncbi:MAG: hypothetical protein ACK5JF_01620 [Oscillospiraceae bacterium]